MAPPSQLFQEWRAASRALHAMELEFTRACLEAKPGSPPEAWHEGRQNLRELRERADELFELAMADMSRRAARASVRNRSE